MECMKNMLQMGKRKDVDCSVFECVAMSLVYETREYLPPSLLLVIPARWCRRSNSAVPEFVDLPLPNSRIDRRMKLIERRAPPRTSAAAASPVVVVVVAASAAELLRRRGDHRANSRCRRRLRGIISSPGTAAGDAVCRRATTPKCCSS